MCRLALYSIAILTALGAVTFASDGDIAGVDYLRDVKPLLDRHCVECHGPTKQQAGLRVDAAALAIAGGDSGAGIVPNDAAKSRILLAVTGESDEASQMPLDRPPLSPEEIDLLRRWIDAGASYPEDEVITEARVESDHWSFQPVVRPVPPRVSADQPLHNPIDAFIQARLADEGLVPAPEADRVTLLRRVTLDLTGLLPTPAEVEAFLNDERPGAYDRVVDRLLASPHYGERWGRHWLDAARYADSNGFTIDGARSMWPYRDWVVGAFNADMPFDQFTIEQLAGDLLPGATAQQLVATGFHRNTLANEEGGTDDEQFRVESVVDRVSTTGTVWMGLTVACAQCHDHKFDPISQRDFYRLYAVFNSTADNNDADGLGPKVDLPTPEQAAQRTALDAQIEAATAPLKARETELADGFDEWLASVSPSEPLSWTPLTPAAAVSEQGATLEVQDDQSVLAGGTIPENDDYLISLPLDPEVTTITAVRLETLTHDSLPKSGPGLATNGNFVLSEISVSLDDQAVSLARATADHSQEKHDVTLAIDGDQETGWAINVSSGSLNVDRQAAFVFAEPLNVSRETEPGVSREMVLKVRMTFRHPKGYQIGRFRLSVTSSDSKSIGLSENLRELVAIEPVKRSEAQNKELADFYYATDADWSTLKATLSKIESEQKSLAAAITTSLVMKELDTPRESFVHLRGNFLQHGAPVTPGVPAVLPEMDAQTPNRLDLAKWLVDPRHPLTARVTVNRIWQRFFGLGFVQTENDFGLQGSQPTHPLLLDWLASEFVRQEWSIKALARLIVTSHTYRQSSHHRPETVQVDPLNRLLARQSRLRLEAEAVRDAALAASGLLSEKMGGPPVHPPQPEGIYVLTQNQKPWTAATNEDRYRRGMYTQFWRSLPHPLMPTFDAPDANTSCTRRVRSNTPLQALTLANDRMFVELSQGLAVRVLTSGPDYDAGRLRELFLIALSRPPSDAESQRLTDFLTEQRDRFTTNPEAATALLTHLTSDLPPIEAAAWTATARVVLNLDEFITRE